MENPPISIGSPRTRAWQRQPEKGAGGAILTAGRIEVPDGAGDARNEMPPCQDGICRSCLADDSWRSSGGSLMVDSTRISAEIRARRGLRPVGEQATAFLVLDTESIPDGRLLQRVKYPTETL